MGIQKILLSLLGQMLLKRLNCKLPDFHMPLGSERESRRSCWNLPFVINLAGNSTHFIIPLFCFLYCRLNMNTIQAGCAGHIDPEADK